MKKNYFLTLLFTFSITAFTFSQGSESFANSNANSSYADNSFVGNNSITWTYVASRDANSDGNGSGITLPALMLRRSSSDSKITSSTISGGIGDFSVKLYKGFTGGGDRQVELFINGVSKGTSTPFDDFNEHVFTVSGINVTGDIVIEIKNTTAKQVIIDDITWTAPSTDPSLSITTPTDNQVFPATTSDVTVNFNISNFVLAGEVGDTEVTDGTGDGYILGSLVKDGVADGTKNIFSNTVLIENVDPGSTYVITAELVDNTGASLSPKVEASVTFSVAFPCDLELTSISTTCDALTSGTDTYNGSIAFTGGNTGVTYTITAPVGVTVGGDDPNSLASGTITFTGMSEGIDTDISIVGGAGSTCDFDRTLNSPTCVAFPVVETFNYTVGENLGDMPLWTNSNSGDEILITAPTIANPFGPGQFVDPTGNMISFSSSGQDPYIEFNQQNTGTIYASFIFTATEVASLTNSNGGYFAVLTQASGSYKPKLWLRQDIGDNTKYNVGVSASSSGATYHTLMHTPGEEIFVVMGYDFTTNEVKVWIDPDPATFGGGTVPTETLKVIASGNDIPTDLGRLLIRQDSSTETPAINFDELRISTSWADVTPDGNTASIGENTIDGFTAYPNPVNNGRLTVKTSNSNKKEVSIYSILGKRVFTHQFTGNNKQIDVSQINSGVYIMKVIEGDKIATKKLVIK